MRRFLRNWGVTLFCFFVWLVLLSVHWLLVVHFAAEEPDASRNLVWMAGVFENLQSEAWQVGFACLFVESFVFARWNEASDQGRKLDDAVGWASSAHAYASRVWHRLKG